MTEAAVNLFSFECDDKSY